MKKILFVCSGNTCRSPLAAAIANKIFSDEGHDFDISSAGTSALDGLPASRFAVEVAKSRSVELSNHQSRLLNRTLVREADLIVTMAASHRDTVGIIEPAALDHTYLLTEFCDDEDGDIPDPIGMGKGTYEATYTLIDKCVRALFEKIDSFDGWKK